MFSFYFKILLIHPGMTNYCPNCGAQTNGTANFCAYCGTRLTETTPALSLLNKSVSTAVEEDEYTLVLISCGTCDKTTAGDILEDIFGYTDAESTKLIRLAPVAVAENLTAEEAATVAQVFTEYGIKVSITNEKNQYVDLTDNAVSSVFDNSGNLLAGAAAIIGALTVANRIKSYRKYKKPSLLERIFHLKFDRKPPVYHRNFRRHLAEPEPQRRMIRKPAEAPRSFRSEPSHRTQPKQPSQPSHGGHTAPKHPQGGHR